ncbi:MAG TPA: YihY family inner membrane protein [Terriglobia bacterium]|nr:YihY family inner membrane protein [Terriglobia bacterium]
MGALTGRAGEALAIGKTMARQAPEFARYVLSRAARDSCPSIAAALGYNSLLAVVPLLAIGLAMFAAFPAFSNIRQDLLATLFNNLAPAIGATVQDYLQTFIRNAGKTTGAGVVALGLTAILLINTIQTAFDRIWGTHAARATFQRLLIYWALLTLGPLLFGASFSISGYVFAKAQSVSGYRLSSGFSVINTVMPFLLEAVGFACFYRLIPSRYVRLGDATTGAFVAALLFELLKRGFGLYLHYFPTYQAVYGALATVPVLLLWTYLAWLIVLYGAEIVAALPEWRAGRRVVGGDIHRSDSFALMMDVLWVLREAASHGSGLKFYQLQSELTADPGRLAAILDNLRRIRVASRSDDDRWHLSRDLRQLSLFDLCRQLGLVLGTPSATPPHLEPLVRHLDAHEREMLGRPVDDWLAQLHAHDEQSVTAGKSAAGGENGIVPIAADGYKSDSN